MRRLVSGRALILGSVAALTGLLFATVALADEIPWDYHSKGGAAGWGALLDDDTGQVAFPDCNGPEQSPVDISGVAASESGIAVDYRDTPLRVANNGHAIQVNYEPGSTFTAGGKTYRLLQFHFHSPSEHTVGGEPAALEAHFVHQAADGEYAVLGVLMVAGDTSASFQRVLDNLPENEGEVLGTGTINASSLLPAGLSHWAYDGSFTTPPCTEGVKWHVLGEPVSVSLPQIAAFRALDFLNHDGEFVGNARPGQPLNGRLGDATSGRNEGITPPDTGSAGLADD